MAVWKGRVFIYERDGRQFASLIPDGNSLAAYKVYGPHMPISEEAPLPLSDWITWVERLREKGFRFVTIETPRWLDQVQARRRAYNRD
jgi:hypothetical protein